MFSAPEELPEPEETEPIDPADASNIAPADSEIDFDERADDQAPLDTREADELGVLLDDPEEMSDE